MPAGQTATSTKEDGKSKYYLRAKNDYKVTISRDGYDVVTTDVSTQNVRPGKSIDKKIILSKYKFIVDGSVTTRSTNVGVPGATVYFKNKTTGEIITVVANEAGIFDYKISPESDYIIYAEKGGMRTNEVIISTMGKKASENFKVDLAFDKELMLAVVYYDFDKTEVRKDDFNKKELDELVALMKAEPTMKVVAKSFADSRGESKYNDKLASKRSNATVAYLVKKGIKKNRIIAQSFGETNLTNRCADGVECSEEEHQANRRTEFIRAEDEVAPAAPANN
jgi:outer membrane protein OmpA-like peptidoglycan-associated protein